MNVLHIIATPRGAKSTTLQVTKTFLDALTRKHGSLSVTELNLFDADLPAAAGDTIESKYALMMGMGLDEAQAHNWKGIEALAKQFLDADLVVISSPLWNFGVPYALKYYIDALVQPGLLFHYTEQGPAGLVPPGKKMVVITSRGGDYSVGSPFHAFDFQEPYLRAIFGFVGVTDVQFVHAQPVDMGPDPRAAALKAAHDQATAIAEGI